MRKPDLPSPTPCPFGRPSGPSRISGCRPDFVFRALPLSFRRFGPTGRRETLDTIHNVSLPALDFSSHTRLKSINRGSERIGHRSNAGTRLIERTTLPRLPLPPPLLVIIRRRRQAARPWALIFGPSLPQTVSRARRGVTMNSPVTALTGPMHIAHSGPQNLPLAGCARGPAGSRGFWAK